MKNLILILILFSVTTFGQIPRYQTIVAGEYFINVDPGEGQGNNLSGNYNLTDVDIKISNINIPIGSTIYVRFKSSDNKWSAPRGLKRQNYFVNSQANLVRAEYYINNDPGNGNGIQANIQSGGINIDSLSLKKGDKVFVRVKDSFERWSPSKLVKFNYKTLSKAEYYVKLGSGSSTTPQSMILDQTNDSSFIYSAYQNNIPWHQNDTVFVRFQSEDKFFSYPYWTKGPLGITSVGTNNNTIITDYRLEQNYPNPFNPTTTLIYQIPKSGIVTLKVYDILGKEVVNLVNEYKKQGKYNISLNASKFASGIYIYIISRLMILCQVRK